MSFTGSYTEDEPNFPRQNNLILQKMVSGVDKVVNFKDFSRSNKEIKYFSRRPLSNQSRFQARKPSCLFPSELNKMAFAAIRRRHFWLKNERKKWKNTQNVLLEGCYLHFDEYLQDIKKTPVYILKP